MNNMYLVLGDPSNDGHGKVSKILLSSNCSVEEIRQAYKDSCRKTSISFNNGDDYTGINRYYPEDEKYQIAVSYGEYKLSKECIDIITNFGYDFDKSLIEEGSLYETSFTDLWIWFVKLSLPNTAILIREKEKDKIPTVNDYPDLNVQFGYGLYD